MTVTPEEQVVACRAAVLEWHRAVESMGLEVMALSTGDLGTFDEWADRGAGLEASLMGAVRAWLSLVVGAATGSALQAAPEKASVVVEEVWGIVLRAVPYAAAEWSVGARRFLSRPPDEDLVGLVLWEAGLLPSDPDFGVLSPGERLGLHRRFLSLHDAFVAESDTSGLTMADWQRMVEVDAVLVAVMHEFGDFGG